MSSDYNTIQRQVPRTDDPYSGPCCEVCYRPGQRPYCTRCITSGSAAKREARKRAA